MGAREIIAERDTTTLCPYHLSVALSGGGGPDVPPARYPPRKRRSRV